MGVVRGNGDLARDGDLAGDGDHADDGRNGGGLGGVDGGGEGEGGGGGVQERGESWIPSPESSSLRSSTSQRRLAAFLVRLAGGRETVGGDCDCSSSGACSGFGGRAVSVGGVNGAEITDWSSLVAVEAVAAGGGAFKA